MTHHKSSPAHWRPWVRWRTNRSTGGVAGPWRRNDRTPRAPQTGPQTGVRTPLLAARDVPRLSRNLHA
ncbi:MAG: hypothetical protein ACKOJF_26595, partial [Planctomycetaceae bacterium]